jgi:FixJ family two-component response regulator
MANASLVSVVEDDRFFRESMGRLMRSMGYTVEALHRRDFLASPRLAETACLIADVHMPAMTGIRTLPTPRRCRARDSDNPRDGLPQ